MPTHLQPIIGICAPPQSQPQEARTAMRAYDCDALDMLIAHCHSRADCKLVCTEKRTGAQLVRQPALMLAWMVA